MGGGVTMASSITNMEVSIAVQVRSKRDALAFTPFADLPGFHSTKGICEEIAVVLSSFPSISGGKNTDSFCSAWARTKCVSWKGTRR